MISIDNQLPELVIGVCELSGIRFRDHSEHFDRWFDSQLVLAKSDVATAEWEERRNEVRALLRVGGFKPSGRSKPAQEYLLRCLNNPPFPRVNVPVDCLNVYSVRIGLPISLLRLDRFPDGGQIRCGTPGESFVFNSAGQELDLEGLICVCGGGAQSEPLGTPVKDSLRGKIDNDTSEAIVIIYAPRKLYNQSDIDRHAAELKQQISTWAIHGID